MKTGTARALRASIKHWEELTKVEMVEEVDLGARSCALCHLFNTEYMPRPDRCIGCPVFEATGRNQYCQGSPYDGAINAYEDWDNTPISYECAEAFRNAAEEELAFLKSLLPKDKD